MDYPQWEHESRDPRDRVVAPPPWSAAGQADEDEYYYDDEPGQRYLSEYGWNRGDRGDPGDRGQRWPGPGDAAGEWVSAEYPDSWQTGTGWVQSHDQRPDDSGYLTDPRYRSGYLYEDAPPLRGGGDRVLDHDDWYESQPGRPLPAPRQRVPITPRPPRAHLRRLEDEDGEPPGRGSVPVALFTVVFYVAPVVLYVLWALTLGDTPEPNCVDPAGNPCGAPRTEALNKLAGNLPKLTTAVGLSVVIALVIRWFNATWRAASIGFAAAVVGAGIATAIFSTIGRPTLG